MEPNIDYMELLVYDLKKFTKTRSDGSVYLFKRFVKLFCDRFSTTVEAIYRREFKIVEFGPSDFDYFIGIAPRSFVYHMAFLGRHYLDIEVDSKVELKNFKWRLHVKNEDFLKNEVKIDKGTPYLSNIELETIYDSIVDDVTRLLFLLFITTGMRRGGFLNCKFENIDFANRTIRTIEKGNKETYYCLSSEILYYLIRDGGSVFDKYGTRFKLQERVKQLGSYINKRVYPHLFRFTFSRIALNNMNSEKHVQDLLDHSGISTTRQSYIKETRIDRLRRTSALPWIVKNDQSRLPSFLTAEHLSRFEDLITSDGKLVK